MSLWQRLFGQKAVEFDPPSQAVQVIAGYPSWPFFDSLGEMYRRQPAVRTVVDFMARNVAQLNPKIYMRIGDNDRREWNDHPLAGLLRNPNPTTTRFAHIRDTVADVAIYDRAYWRLLRAPNRGLISALVRIPPSRLQMEMDQQTLRMTYRLDGQVITRREMVIFHGYHPDGGEQGVSPLETLRRVLAEDWASGVHREWYWRNGSRIEGVIERSLDAPEWGDTERDRFRTQWEQRYSGGVNSGRTAILEDGMKWNPAGFSPKDSEYIEGRKLTNDEVARVYAPSLVGLMRAEGTNAAVESYHRQLYQDALAPTLRMIQDEIDQQLLTLDEFDFGPAYCEFNLQDKLKGSFEEQGRTLTTAVGVAYMSVNEGRTRQNLPRIDDPAFDVPIKPLNVLYGGQPAVTIPTEDPGMRSRDFAAKLRSFFDRQEQTVCSQLGGLKDQGEMTVLAVWQEARWNRELTKLFQLSLHPEDAEAVAVALNSVNRLKVVSAYAAGGLDAVHEVFTDAKTAADEHARLRVSALTA